MGKTIRLALDELLKRENITRYELSKRTKIGYPVVDKYYKNKVVRYDSETIRRICLALDCTPRRPHPSGGDGRIEQVPGAPYSRDLLYVSS